MSLLLRMCRLQHTCMCSGPLNTILPVPQVAMLFRSHKDLLEEFTYFLPDAQAPAQVLLAPPHTWRTLHPVLLLSDVCPGSSSASER